MTSGILARIRLGSAAASFPVFAVAVIVLGSVTPGYSQWSDPVSRLASSGERWAPEAMTVIAVYGAMIIVGSGSLGPYGQPHETLLALTLASYGVACVVAGIAPKNPPGTPPTLLSRVHVTAAVVGGALLLVAMVLIARCAASKLLRCTAIAMVVLTALVIAIFRLTWGTPVYGLNERLLLCLGMGWISALAALRWRAAARPLRFPC